jgi:short-subunit dehydrogenase
MRRQLEGKVAIVTGASSGVGWQTAQRLAWGGASVCVTARRFEPLQELCRLIEFAGAQAHAVAGDVTDDAQVRRVVDECLERFGHLDILVNNAAVQGYGYFDQLQWEMIQRTFDVNAFGPMRFARAVLPHFRRQRSGHIVNVASMLSRGAAPLLASYAASKHAMLGWSEALRLELYSTGIDVSAVLVPSVATPMFDHAPTMFSLAPRPVPPTYHPDVAARAIVKVIRRPRSLVVPAFLQGKLVLWTQRWVAPFTDRLLGRFGPRMQMRNEPVDRPQGSLFHPIPEGVGPLGSVPPTPAWKRLAAGAALFGLAGGALGAVGYGGVKLAGGFR